MMTETVRRAVPVLSLVTLLVAAGPVAHASPPGLWAGWAGPAASARVGWRVEPGPAGDGLSLAGVACISGARCVAVGRGHAEGWNGRAWAPLPAPRGAGVLSAIACTSARYCIAVGSGTGHRAAAWSWNGRTWVGQAVRNPGSAGSELAAIACASARSCEAVGSHGGASSTFPLAEKWDGRTWARQSTAGAPHGILAGVACTSARGCEAVGARYGSSVTTLAMAWNGRKWTTQRTPVIAPQHGSPPGEPYELNGISCWSSGCTAVGTVDYCDCTPSSSGNILLAERWNGKGWKLQGTLGTGVSPFYSSATWSAVHCSSASACTAAGEWTEDNVSQPYFTLISRWNGVTWAQVASPSPDSNGNMLNAISCSSSACTAVGVRCSSSACTALTVPTDGDAQSGNSLAMRD
jgi:hypothetical protein